MNNNNNKDSRNEYTGRKRKKDLTFHPTAWKFIYPNFWDPKVLKNKHFTYGLPAYSSLGSARIPKEISEGQIEFVDAVQESDSKRFPSPKFVTFINRHLNREIMRQNCEGDYPSTVRLNIYNEVFHWIIEACTTYKPIFAAIKREYDLVLRKYQMQLKRLRPMKDIAWTLEAYNDEKIVQHHKTEEKKEKCFEREKKVLQKEMWDLASLLEDYRVQIKCLLEDIAKEENLFKVEKALRKQMIIDVNVLKAQLDEMAKKQTKLADFEEIDIPKLRKEYRLNKMEHGLALRRITEIHATYVEVQAKSGYIDIEEGIAKRVSQITEMQPEHEALEKEVIELRKTVAILQKESAAYEKKYVDLNQIKPDLTKVAEVLFNLEKMNQRQLEENSRRLSEDKSSSDSIATVSAFSKSAMTMRSDAPEKKVATAAMEKDKVFFQKILSVTIKPSTKPAAVRATLEMLLGLMPGTLLKNVKALKDSILIRPSSVPTSLNITPKKEQNLTSVLNVTPKKEQNLISVDKSGVDKSGVDKSVSVSVRTRSQKPPASQGRSATDNSEI